MKTTTFLNNVVKDAFSLFDYYRHGPVPMHKLQPGFIFQQCVDAVLAKRGIASIESGLGDHCLPDLGLAIQLKTTVQENEGDRIIFCRSSVANVNEAKQKAFRINDVESRIYDMFGTTETSQFILLHVNLTKKDVHQFLLHDGEKVVGTWLQAENVLTPHRQTHFWVKTRNMKKLA